MVKIEKTKDVIYALRNKYDDQGWSYAFLQQVSNGTGNKCNRWCDALAVQLWESRGLEIIGFEVKVSRTDWIKELKHPEKADAIAKYCHQWYLVVGDENIVQFGELPTTWGLMVPHTKKSLKIVKPAVRNEKPKSVDMPFLCAVLRRAVTQHTTKARLTEEHNRGYSDGFKDGKEEMQGRIKWRDERNNKIENQIEEFQKASGFSITEKWSEPKEVGEAVKMVLDGTYLKEKERLERLHNHALSIAEDIKEELDKIREN